MAKQKGRLFLVKLESATTAGTFNAFCGLTQKSLKVNSERIDATTPNCADPGGVLWRETLDGVKSVSVSGSGKLTDEASESDLWDLAMQPDAKAKFEIVIPAVGTFAGTFTVDVELSGDGTVDFDISMESDGPVTFVKAA
ncbi:phage tail tube protein [Sulfitobacter sp. 1A16787]|uniref:phage tail tube protein n=1 Tax=Sulfitobacter sp. 1A16787 TaxID=3368571 RepID=UPI0037473899